MYAEKSHKSFVEQSNAFPTKLVIFRIRCCCFALLIFCFASQARTFIYTDTHTRKKNGQTRIEWSCLCHCLFEIVHKTKHNNHKINAITSWCKNEGDEWGEKRWQKNREWTISPTTTTTEKKWQVNTTNFVLGWQFKMKCFFFSCRIYFVVQLTTNTSKYILSEWSTQLTQFTKPQKITFVPHSVYVYSVLTMTGV